ncbi:DNA mismatch repair endonuclease MutL, partial [Candidatus Peregrinibacteria bacterium]|nr:DNA mismatch repair endonuclease MutL [Candidatus Peregrinibacteria bacterium]
MTSKIKLLDEKLINQIAAGEVVERPASIVKELIENSIDANANQIVVEVDRSGEEKIRITDDGVGMSKEDAILCLERHATSKIATLEDLKNIKSMGFRGEALASIASVSKMKINTKRRGENVGTELFIDGGKLEYVKDKGIPEGTVLEIRELFFNTPARKKFLKSDNVEYQNILDVIINAALAYPEIAFKLIKDQRPIFDLPKARDLLMRIRAVLGKNISDDMIDVFYGGVNMKMTGFIGKPSIARASKNLQYFFVNNRPIKSHVLSYAVKQAYHSLIPKERNPVFVINFDLSPELVDVNVHPRKSEVKFKDEREIFRILTSASKKALEINILAPKFSYDQPSNFYQEKRPEGIAEQLNFNEVKERKHALVQSDQKNDQMAVASETKYNPVTEVSNEKSFLDEEIEVIGQFDDSFIICKKGENLVLIDQHAAHERVRFEMLKSEDESKEKVIQNLLTPISFELNHQDMDILNSNKAVFESIGVSIEHFG